MSIFVCFTCSHEVINWSPGSSHAQTGIYEEPVIKQGRNSGATNALGNSEPISKSVVCILHSELLISTMIILQVKHPCSLRCRKGLPRTKGRQHKKCTVFPIHAFNKAKLYSKKIVKQTLERNSDSSRISTS